MPILLAFLALIASSGSSKTPKLPTPEKPPKLPKPGAADKKARDLVCQMAAEGLPTTGILPLLLRELYPAVSWPAADEWTDEEVSALPVEDLATYAKGKRALEDMTADDAWLAQCTRMQSPYGSGRVRRRNGKFEANWSYDARVFGARGGALKTSFFDNAREIVASGVWWFGASPADSDSFVEAHLKPGTENRLSIWEMPDGAFRVTVLRSDRDPEYVQVGTLAAARAVVGAL